MVIETQRVPKVVIVRKFVKFRLIAKITKNLSSWDTWRWLLMIRLRSHVDAASPSSPCFWIVQRSGARRFGGAQPPQFFEGEPGWHGRIDRAAFAAKPG